MATEFNTQVGNGKYCLQFETDNKEHYLLMQSAARRCIDRAHMTNADRIRSMSDEELDCFLHKVTYGMDGCPYVYGSEKALEWLQKPAEETER